MYISDRIKGRVKSPEAREAPWNRHFVMSDDLSIIEMQSDGKAVGITTVIRMANTAGMDANEICAATAHICAKCGAGNLPVLRNLSLIHFS